MAAIDLLFLPLGCIACGALASASVLLRYLPKAELVVHAMLPYRSAIGAATAVAAAIALFFPASGPPIFGSLFPASSGILSGGLFSLELLAGSRFFAGRKELLARVGNALLYLKKPIGLSSLFFGICHLFFHEALFF